MIEHCDIIIIHLLDLPVLLHMLMLALDLGCDDWTSPNIYIIQPLLTNFISAENSHSSSYSFYKNCPFYLQDICVSEKNNSHRYMNGREAQACFCKMTKKSFR